MVLKFDPHGALMINRGNRISIVFHIFCCSMHKLSTIPLANVASLARFFMLAIWFKKLFNFFFLYFISLYHLRLDYHYGIQQAWICLTPLTNFFENGPQDGHFCHMNQSRCQTEEYGGFRILWWSKILPIGKRLEPHYLSFPFPSSTARFRYFLPSP